METREFASVAQALASATNRRGILRIALATDADAATARITVHNARCSRPL